MGICINQWRLVIGSFVQCSVFSSDMTRTNCNRNIYIFTFLLVYSLLVISAIEVHNHSFRTINISMGEDNYRIIKPGYKILVDSGHYGYYFDKNISYLHCISKFNNCNMRRINGNIKAPSLRIIHWNKGSSKFSNKIDDIKLVIDKFRPHIFSIVEANYDLIDRLMIEGYNIETDTI